MNYLEGIEIIQKYTAGTSAEPVLEYIAEVPFDGEGFADSLDAIGGTNRYPDTFIGLLSFMSFMLDQKKFINGLYEQALSRYEELSAITAKRKPNEEEAKIKKTITDFILKIEKDFEIQGLADESLVKELNRFAFEVNLLGVTENEVRQMRLPSKTVALVEPHLDKNRECFYEYKKLKDTMQRLIRIADYILEDSKKTA